jgi:hypothetical protein
VKFTRRHARAAALAAATVAILAGASAAPASAAGHHIRPDFSCGSCNIIEGTGFGAGAPDPSPGHPVTQEAVGRTMTWHSQTTYLGYDAGYWTLNASGGYMATTSGCGGVTVKSSAASTGTVWFMVDAGGGKWYVGNRACDNLGAGNVVLASDGVLHHQYSTAVIGACCGLWEKQFIG